MCVIKIIKIYFVKNVTSENLPKFNDMKISQCTVPNHYGKIIVVKIIIHLYFNLFIAPLILCPFKSSSLKQNIEVSSMYNLHACHLLVFQL